MTLHVKLSHARCIVTGLFVVLSGAGVAAAGGVDTNDPGILEPALTATTGEVVRIPNTDQADGDMLLNRIGAVVETNADRATSMMGHAITRVTSPNDDMRDALQQMAQGVDLAEQGTMIAGAQDLLDILLGETQGRIYDGFAMLNYNRGAFTPGHVSGEYKMKTLTDSGLTAPGMDGEPRRIWEVTVNYLWYDGQFDSDTFMLRVPVDAHAFDTLRVHYRIHSLETEDFSPTTVLLDHRLPGCVQFPFKGFDSVWLKCQNDHVTEITVDHPPLRLLRGVYTWGWRVHPPRIHFLQPIYEMVNAHTGAVQLEPQGESYAYRNRQLTIEDIGDAAPEKKMYVVATAALNGATTAEVAAMLSDPGTAPRGTWSEWADLAESQTQLPPEALDVLADEGISPGDFGPYRYVTAYMNNEMYGDGPDGNRIEGWFQGDQFSVKLINLDNHAHYFRNVDFGPKLHDDIASGGFSSGSHSFEIMNFKPTYGAPKVAEMQWRAGWGFRPHFDVIQQPDVFSRPSDRPLLKTIFDGEGGAHLGWQYSAEMRGGDFRFNPPNFIITDTEAPSTFRLKDSDGVDGLVIGQMTEGYGVAKMCSHAEHAFPGFCETDISAFNPHGAKNIDTDGDGINDVLWFPPFIRNPNPDGGDIIPPTPAWKPFLWINPNNGTLFIDPADPSQGYWADLTYAHGAPIAPGASLDANIEQPRASGQVFYQFDDLFHDNAIFSPHPTFSPFNPPTCLGDTDGNGLVNIDDIVNVVLDWGTDGTGHGGDVNGSGVVDIDDVVQVVLAFGPCL